MGLAFRIWRRITDNRKENPGLSLAEKLQPPQFCDDICAYYLRQQFSFKEQGWTIARDIAFMTKHKCYCASPFALELHSTLKSACATDLGNFLDRIPHSINKSIVCKQARMDRLNRMLASAGGMSGLNNAAPGSVSSSPLHQVESEARRKVQ